MVIQARGRLLLRVSWLRNWEPAVISLDDYLRGNQKPYAEQLDYEALRTDIVARSTKVVIEGVCALKVLAVINVRPDYHIFIKRLNGIAGWEYADHLQGKSKPPKSKLTREVLQYYREFKPFEVCNVML